MAQDDVSTVKESEKPMGINDQIPTQLTVLFVEEVGLATGVKEKVKVNLLLSITK